MAKKRIDELKQIVFGDFSKEKKVEAINELTEMAIFGKGKAAKVLSDFLEKEKDKNIWLQPFRYKRKENYKEEDCYIFYSVDIIMDKINELSDEERKIIIDFMRDRIRNYSGCNRVFVKEILKILKKIDDNYIDFAKEMSKKDSFFSIVFEAFRDDHKFVNDFFDDFINNYEDYKDNFVEIFDFFLKQKTTDIPIRIGKELWPALPEKFKEAVKLHYMLEMDKHERSVKYRDIRQISIIDWLESFEKDKITNDVSVLETVEVVSNKIGLNFSGELKIVWTNERSPFSILKEHGELNENEIQYPPIDKLFGKYIPEEKLVKIFISEIEDYSERYNIDFIILKQIIEYHEISHAIFHVGVDLDGNVFGTYDYNMVDGGEEISPLHETVAQLLTYHVIKNDKEKLAIFYKLNKRQLKPYKLWEIFKDIPLEKVRNILIMIRRGEIKGDFETFKYLLLS